MMLVQEVATNYNSLPTQREQWEVKMLRLALKSLQKCDKTNPEIQTTTFAQNRYRVTLHIPTETLHIVDELNHRGTLYKAKKGEKADICEFTKEEKEEFLQQSQTKQRMQQSQLSSQQPDESTRLKMKKGIEQGD